MLFRSQWEDKFTLLEQYKQREGNCDVPRSHKALGLWLNSQRQEKKKGKLDPLKEERLENIGVVWNMLSQQWEDKFTLLEQYKQRKGNCDVPRSYRPLGNWLERQRRKKKKGKLDPLKEERLEKIGIAWDVLSQQWEDMYH